MTATYSFPILDNQELLACLAELDIPFSEATLMKPSYESVRPLYESLVTMLVGVTR
jgi:kinetochore protein Nuf2